MNNKNNFIHKCLWIRKKVVSLQPERLKIEDYGGSIIQSRTDASGHFDVAY